MTIPGDGIKANPNITDIPYLKWVAWVQDIEFAMDQRDGVCRENNALRTEKAALVLQLDIVASCADTILDALKTQRAAIEAVAPNGGWTIEQVKAVELAARVIREVKAHYGKGNVR